MSDDDCNSEHHASNDSALERTDCALECNDDIPELTKAQIVHRYVNNFHIHQGGQGLKCGNCGAEKNCPRCNDTVGKQQCEVCGIWISSSPGSINQHSRIHSGERPFKCYVCGQSFKQFVHLVQHQRIHMGVYPYTCDKCGNSFRQQTHLNEHHQSVHSEDRRFQCNQCSKAYKLRKALMKHYRKQHKCAYECPDCGERLFTRDTYTIHHSKHVKERATTASEAGDGNGEINKQVG